MMSYSVALGTAASQDVPATAGFPCQCLGGCNRLTQRVNILTQTHYMGDMFRLYHLAILRPHTATYEQNI
jgi:hypothetical protein